MVVLSNVVDGVNVLNKKCHAHTSVSVKDHATGIRFTDALGDYIYALIFMNKI